MPKHFDDVIDLPDDAAERRYRDLVGLDQIKDRLSKEAEVLLQPDLLKEWSRKHHGRDISATASLLDRPPLFVFGGDVGTGKTTLAETFGNSVARDHRTTVRVYRLSLQTRGVGAVGEMTSLITNAFDEVLSDARKAAKVGHILVIDEADALAQSRDFDQMHHEDRAGVNALIRGIDHITAERLRVLVVMCTNRIEALDPAVRRRAAAEFLFERPGPAQRTRLFEIALAGTGISLSDIASLAEATGAGERGFGYTYSDIVNRVVPAAVLLAYPSGPLTTATVMRAIDTHPPTRPFGDAK